MAERGRHSYISSDDLASLDLSPPTTPTEHSQPASAATKAPHSSDSPPPSYRDNEEDASSLRTSRKCHKRVLFCPLALLIETAAEGEKDPWLSERAALAQRTGRPRLAVRTYSVGTPSLPSTSNISSATSRAWKSVCAGFSTSLQPLLSPTSAPRRDSSPEREREATSFARSRSYSDPKNREEEDDSFLPDHDAGKLKIKLPALRRCCVATALSSSACKSILKSTSSSSRPIDLPSPSATANSTQPRTAESFPALSPVASLPQSLSSIPLPILAPQSLPFPSSSSPPKSTSMPQPQPLASTAPLRPCCQDCTSAALYGLSPEGEGGYQEHFSLSARRKRKREKLAAEEERRIDEELCGRSMPQSASFSPYCKAAVSRAPMKEEKREELDGDEEDEPLQGGGLALAVKTIDEVQCVRRHRGESDFPQGSDGFEEEEGSETGSSAAASSDQVVDTPRPVEGAPQSQMPATANEGGLLTPPLSPDPTDQPAPKPALAIALPSTPSTTLPSPPTSPTTPSNTISPISPISPTSTARPAPSKRRFSLSSAGTRLSQAASAAGRGIVQAGTVGASAMGGVGRMG